MLHFEISLNVLLRDQRLKENDHILAINCTPLDQNISHQHAIALLQQSTGSLHLVVAREPIQGNSRTSAVLSDINPPETVSAILSKSDFELCWVFFCGCKCLS